MASPPHSSSPFIALLALSLLLHSTAAPPPASECVTELVMFSPCLAFVSSPPNNLSATVPPTCCDAFLAVISSSMAGRGGGSSCLCYLLREPRMLGFPLDQARVLSLPAACTPDDLSLEDLCSVSEAMPPSQNVTDSGISSPPDSAPSSQPSPLMGLPPESHNPTPSPSLSPDSDDATEESSPLPETANRPRSPSTPRLPLGFSTSASGNRFYGGKCLFQLGSLVLSFLVHTSSILDL